MLYIPVAHLLLTRYQEEMLTRVAELHQVPQLDPPNKLSFKVLQFVEISELVTAEEFRESPSAVCFHFIVKLAQDICSIGDELTLCINISITFVVKENIQIPPGVFLIPIWVSPARG